LYDKPKEFDVGRGEGILLEVDVKAILTQPFHYLFDVTLVILPFLGENQDVIKVHYVEDVQIP
jgi:hypothetical protein